METCLVEYLTEMFHLIFFFFLPAKFHHQSASEISSSRHPE